MTNADKERSPKDESKRLLKVAATCLFLSRKARTIISMFRAYSSVWKHLGRETRSAIQGTPSPTTRQYTSVPSVLHCNVKE